MTCCEKCRIYWTCETKWFRGERREENICCSTCDFYDTCSRGDQKENRPTPNKAASF